MPGSAGSPRMMDVGGNLSNLREGSPTRYMTSLSLAAGVAAGLLGLLVFIGWLFDITLLKSVRSDWASMKMNTALGVLLAGAALTLRCLPRSARWRQWLGRCCALVVAVIGLTTLTQYVFGWDLRIDGLLLPASAAIELAPAAFRMSAISAVNLSFLGLSMLLLDRVAAVGQVLALLCGFLALLGLEGYMYGGAALSEMPGYGSIGIHTAVAFLLLAAGILAARPDQGLVKVTGSATGAGSMARRLLPAAIFLPLILGWLRLQGERAGLYGTELGLVLFAVSNVLLLVALVIWSARIVYRSESSLRKSLVAFQSLFEAAPDAMLVVDRLGLVVRANENAQALFGYPLNELLGHPVEMLIPERFRDRHPQLRRGYFDRPSRRGMGTGLDLRARRKDGVEIPVDISLGPIEDSDSLLAVATIRDITDRKRASDLIAQYASSLEQRNEELQEFAAVASHDLQEPLRKISAFGERLKTQAGESLDAEARDSLSRMLHASRRMSQLIEGLLNLSRVTTKGFPFKKTHLGEVVAEVLKDLEVRIREAGAHVDVGDLPTLHADRLQMRQLFQNLIANALKFRNADRPPLVSITGEHDQDTMWRIAVSDNGIGFDEKYLARLFRPFQRLHGRNEYEGSGMGLAICKRIVQRHGGEITARSTPGAGSTFVVTLPENPASKESPNEKDTTIRHPSDGRGR